MPHLVRLASATAGEPALCEEAVQTALVRAWLASRRSPRRPLAYTRRVVLNEVLATRRRPFRPELPTPDMPDVVVYDGADARAQTTGPIFTDGRRGLARRRRAGEAVPAAERTPAARDGRGGAA